MPSKHLVRKFDSPAYYHIYNRGAGKQKIFIDSQDKRKFLSLMERYLLSPGDESVKVYPKYDAEVVAYCLMGSHFHLLLYQEAEPKAFSELMKSVGTAYTMYFNRRHKASGHLFEGPYRATIIKDESHLAHITRYIHLNPRTYQTYRWSSLRYYLGKETSAFIHPERILDMSAQDYVHFLEEYEPRRHELKALYADLVS